MGWTNIGGALFKMKTSKVDIDNLLSDTTDAQEIALNSVMEMEEELIRNLIKRRKELGLSQEDVANITGMDQQSVSRMETFGAKPITNTLIKYLVALQLDINILFDKGVH